MKQRFFFTARPTLVDRIVEAGYPCEMIQDNVFVPGSHAWLVPACAEVVSIYREYYGEMGREVPVGVQAWIKQYAAEQGEDVTMGENQNGGEIDGPC